MRFVGSSNVSVTFAIIDQTVNMEIFVDPYYLLISSRDWSPISA